MVTLPISISLGTRQTSALLQHLFNESHGMESILSRYPIETPGK